MTKSGLAADQSHYQTADKQPIEIMQDYLSHEQFIGFLHGKRGETHPRANKCNKYVEVEK